jgi:glycosyltransferase involved in cell wall biosynthesis
MEGVEIVRLRSGAVTSQAKMVLRYPWFFFKGLRLAKNLRPDAVHAHDLDTLPLGLTIARLRRIPLVFDAHERYAKMIAIDVPPFVSRSAQAFEDLLAPQADISITINEVMAEELAKKTGREVVIIMNCIDLPPASAVKVHDEHSPLILINPVTFEPMRYIEESMEAMSNIDRCILRIAGSGRLLPAVEKAAKEHSNIEFLGHLPFRKLMDEYERVDVVLVLLDPANENYRNGSANKMGEGMAFGLPLIVSKGTLTADVVESEGCGIAIDWSEDNFRQAIDRLRNPAIRNEMGRKGREAAEREYNWGAMRDRLQKAYARLLSTEP